MVQEQYGPAKPVVAREVAIMLAAGGANGDHWKPLRDLAVAINGLTSESKTAEPDLVQTIKVLFNGEAGEKSSEKEDEIETPF